MLGRSELLCVRSAILAFNNKAQASLMVEGRSAAAQCCSCTLLVGPLSWEMPGTETARASRLEMVITAHAERVIITE